MGGGRRKTTRKRKKKKGRKKEGKRQKLRLKSSSDCTYEGSVWSECDPNTGLQTTVQTLNADSDPTKCEKTVAITRRCNSSSSVHMVQNALGEQRQQKGEGTTKLKNGKRKKN